MAQAFQSDAFQNDAFEVGGAAAQTLLPSLYTNTSSFFAPTVTRGAVTLAPTLYTNAQTFYAPTATTSVTLTAVRYDNSNSFFSPTVAPGGVTLAPALFSNTSAFYAATVSSSGGVQSLLPSLFSNSNTLYSPAVTRGAVTLTPSRYNNASTFYSPAATYSYTLTPARLENANTFFAPALALTLQPNLFTQVNSFYPAVVDLGGVIIEPSLVTNDSTFYSPLVSQPGGTQYLICEDYVVPGYVLPGYTSFPSSFTDNRFYTAILSQDQFVFADRLDNSNRFFTNVTWMEYPDPRYVKSGVVYGPSGIYTGSLVSSRATYVFDD